MSARRLGRVVAAVASLGAIVASTGAARASGDEQWVLAPGAFYIAEELGRVRDGRPDSPRFGGGVEASLMRYSPAVWKNPWGYGFTGQASIVNLDGHAAVHGALGVQAGTFVGVEAGLYARSGSGRYGAEGGLRLAPYFSFGWFWAALPLELPVIERDGALNPGFHVSVLVGMKLPFALDGSSLFPGSQDRPVRVPVRPAAPDP